jgi:hypothetical protein
MGSNEARSDWVGLDVVSSIRVRLVVIKLDRVWSVHIGKIESLEII